MCSFVRPPRQQCMADVLTDSLLGSCCIHENFTRMSVNFFDWLLHSTEKGGVYSCSHERDVAAKGDYFMNKHVHRGGLQFGSTHQPPRRGRAGGSGTGGGGVSIAFGKSTLHRIYPKQRTPNIG